MSKLKCLVTSVCRRFASGQSDSNFEIYKLKAQSYLSLLEIANRTTDFDISQNMRSTMDDITELFLLAKTEDDDSLKTDCLTRISELSDNAKEEVINAAMSSQYDEGGCYLQIQAGPGGLDAFDWTNMLHEMYLGWSK